ncbi:MAG: hypothetical protein EOM20_21970 [Spartobacteria bacterium]|nr:hypothetical protein [Spartobacteria bacterium]
MNKRMMELALVRAIPDLTIGELKPSRLKGLYERLQREVDQDLARLPRPSQSEIYRIADRVNEFGRATGWLGQQRHVSTLLSFCAEMIENSRFNHNPKILETINDIIAHLESGKDLPAATFWAGSLAAEKWRELMV